MSKQPLTGKRKRRALIARRKEKRQRKRLSKLPWNAELDFNEQVHKHFRSIVFPLRAQATESQIAGIVGPCIIVQDSGAFPMRILTAHKCLHNKYRAEFLIQLCMARLGIFHG